jgi:hypothetical protein
MTFIKTFTGKRFDYLNISVDNIDIIDIAHGLSHLCRFAGHVKEFYSVAQHSVLCAKVAKDIYNDPILAMYALMHDASEAYCIDVPRPLKKMLSNYEDIESRVQEGVLEKFSLNDYSMYKPMVKEIDNRMLITEANLLLTGGTTGFTDPIAEPYSEIEITPWSSESSKRMFLIMFAKLFHGVKINDI